MTTTVAPRFAGGGTMVRLSKNSCDIINLVIALADVHDVLVPATPERPVHQGELHEQYLHVLPPGSRNLKSL